MDQNTRRRFIMEMVSSRKEASLSELAQACGYSPMTIRRDLAQLEKNGYLTVQRGIVRLIGISSVEVSSTIKARRYMEEKKRIAKAAAAYVREGSTLYLDCGTTTRELALELVNFKDLTVYTNSLLVMNALFNFPNIKLYVLPGRFYTCSMGSADISTLQAVHRLNFDAVFLGTEAVDPNLGFMVPDDSDSQCKQEVVAKSEKAFVLADSSKMYSRARYIYATPEEISAFITDDKCPDEAKNTLIGKGVDVIVV